MKVDKKILDKTYILTGQEIYDFIKDNTCFDELDMESWFIEFLKRKPSLISCDEFKEKMAEK